MIDEGLSGLMSPRSVEDILAERVRITLAKREYVLPVLPMGPEAEWKASLDAGFNAILAAVGGDAEAAIALLSEHGDKLLDALIAYDRDGILPPREAILAEASQIEVIRAALEVRQSATPLVVIALAVMMAGLQANGSSQPSSSPPRSTAGRRGRSGKR
jgi:hypothetical protein